MAKVEDRTSGWGFDDDAVEAGVRAGLARAAKYELLEADAPFDELPSAVQDQLGGTIQTVVPPSPRAVELFAEVATVAALARGNYEEPQLTRGQVEEYLEQTAGFLNSFWHA